MPDSSSQVTLPSQSGIPTKASALDSGSELCETRRRHRRNHRDCDSVAGSFRRIKTITVTDFKFRFRRASGLVLLLAIAAGVYLMVPDVRTGSTLMQVGGRRVLYNSASVALGTAMFCSILLMLFGYYLVSNSFRRDIISRTGLIIAATPVLNAEYIVGKFLGGVAYLSAVMVATMLSSMVMFLLRGEGPLEPLVFLSTYALLAIPGILFCAGIALMFESIPFLSGRFGDVLYFFVWTAVVSLPATFSELQTPPRWVDPLDILGVKLLIQEMWLQFHTTAVSVGQTTFDPSKPAIVFPGIVMHWDAVMNRCLAFIFPGIFLTIATLAFHRFNPEKTKYSVRNTRRNPVARSNAALKPLTRFLHPFAIPHSGAPSFLNAISADVFATLILSPLIPIAAIVIAVLSLVLDVTDLQEGLIPVIVVVIILSVADIATRDFQYRTLPLVFSAPKLKANYVGWKFISALVLTFCFTAIPIMRLMVLHPVSGTSLLVGSCFMAGCAIGFAVLTRSRKLFIVLFLMLFYISLNARDEPLLDFAGFNGRGTLAVQIGYLALTIMVMGTTVLIYRLRSERDRE